MSKKKSPSYILLSLISFFLLGCSSILEENENVIESEGPGFDIRSLLSLSPHPNSNFIQGMAVHNNYAFVFYTYGYCKIIDLKNKTNVCQTQLASQANNNHANCAMFSKIYFDEKDKYPLLYISPYGKQRCFVERFHEDSNSFELVQTIYVETTEYKNDYGEFLIDEDRGILYDITFNGKYSDYFVIKSFNIPSYKHTNAYLYDEDLISIKRINLNIRKALQGGTIYQGDIYLMFGDNISQRELNIIRTKDFSIEQYDIADRLYAEPEDIDIYENSIILSTNYPLGLWNLYNF